MEIIPKLPASLPTSIIVVQHILPKFIPVLVRRLKKESLLTVEKAREGEILQKGKVYLAPGDYHVELGLQGEQIKISLNNKEPLMGVRPSLNILLSSAVDIFQGNILTIILTGMGRDGCEGVKKLKELNGFVIAEAEETCIVYGMPKAVVEEGLANLVLPLYNIPQAIIKYFNLIKS